METLLAPIITTLVAAFSGWFFGRRKQTAEAAQSELEAIEKAVTIWREIAQDLKKELGEQSLLLAEQSLQIQKLQEEIGTLRRDNARLLSELKQIKKVQNQQSNEN
ncbi:hypothetical protein [Sphingobacterium siyangense]|uniref:hypothetical protein n=1 Tax=Sphingobacterium siyangense TaxID=459529 RepID=UPI003015C843